MGRLRDMRRSTPHADGALRPVSCRHDVPVRHHRARGEVGRAVGARLEDTLAVHDKGDDGPDRQGLATAGAADRHGREIAAARDAWRRAPDRRDAAFRLCALLLADRDPDAQTMLAACLARFPEPSAGWVEIGEALLAARQPAAALVCFARGLPSASLSIRRGTVARDLGRHAEARACFADATRRDPASARAWFLLGTAAEDARDLPAAAQAYRQVLAIDPARAEAAVNLGIVLQASGRLDEAKDAYAQAVRSRADAFGRVAQALPGAARGELWLDLTALRRHLGG